jgi:AcrR family transcriptional regulator
VFAGLGELLEALLDRQEKRALAQLSRVLPAVPADEDPDRFLAGVARSLAEAVAGDPDTWRPILLPPEGTPAAVRERVDRDRERVRRQIEVLLAWSVARRGGPPGFDVELASHALVAVAEHGGRLVLSDPERFSPSRLAGLVEVLLGASAPLADGP